MTARILAPADLRCRQQAQTLSPSHKHRQVVPTIQPKQARTQSRFNHTFLFCLVIPSPAFLPSWILLGKALESLPAVRPWSCTHINEPCLLRHSLYGDRSEKHSPLYTPDRVNIVILRVRFWFLVLSFSNALPIPSLLPNFTADYSSLSEKSSLKPRTDASTISARRSCRYSDRSLDVVKRTCFSQAFANLAHPRKTPSILCCHVASALHTTLLPGTRRCCRLPLQTHSILVKCGVKTNHS